MGMVPDFCEDGEGVLLSRLHAIVGPDLPIAVTIDLHAMATPLMIRPPIAAKVVVCDCGVLATPRAELRPYVRMRRPIWSLGR